MPMDESLTKDPVDALVLDLLEWIGPCERPYSEVLDAWRTSCPRLPVWEEANARGYLEPFTEAGRAMVRLTPAGRDELSRRRASPAV
jgi:hypothetical protein